MLIWHSSREEQGRQLTQNTAAVHWCLVTAHLYAEWNFIGKDGGAQGCCQLLWHGSTEEQGRQLTLNTAAVHWCMVTANLYAGLAQQQRRTRQAVNPKHCSSALVYGDCKPVCSVDLHRCKCSGTRLLSAGLAQQHRRTRQAVNPKHCSGALVYGDCKSVCWFGTAAEKNKAGS